MPKVSVYLPDPLYEAARKRGIAISTVTQQALEAELRRQANVDWIAQARSRRPRVGVAIDTSTLVDEIRGEFGT